MSDSKAKRLLALAETEPDRLQRHLLVAAALREVMDGLPIVVGGTAEEFWTSAPYHETDLDLCATFTDRDRSTLTSLGFRKAGRHWVHEASGVAVEFPDTTIDGDMDRIEEVRTADSYAAVIGLDDLYLDRLRQSTVSQREGIEFLSALAVVTTRYDHIDWNYVDRRIEEITREGGPVGPLMKTIDSRIRRRVRRLNP